MAIVFSSSFASLTFDDWDVPPAPGGTWPEYPRIVPGQGAAGGNALACGYEGTGSGVETNVVKYLAASHYVYGGPSLEPPVKHLPYPCSPAPSQLTLRASLGVFMSSYYIPDPNPAGGTYPFLDPLMEVGGAPFPYIAGSSQFWTYAISWFDGILYVRSYQNTVGCVTLPAPPFSPGQGCIVCSASHPFPITGEQFSLQWAMRFTGLRGYSCEVAVNGVQVCAGSVTASVLDQGYFDYALYHTIRIPTCRGYASNAPDVIDPPGVPGRLDFGNSTSYVEVDDQYAILPGFAPKNAPKMTEWLCWNQEAAPTAVVADVGANTLTVTGSNFRPNDPGFGPQVQGPEGIWEGYTLISASDTQLVLGSLNPPVVEGGAYCVTVRNPCT
jgi:hypothetical protein